MAEFSAVIDLSTLDGTNGFRLNGIDAYDYSGFSVASAGDVNGDGFDDIVIGARGGDPGGASAAGESYVVFGKAGGFVAVLNLASLDGTNGFRLDGIDASDFAGFSVACAGDVNGDGFDDLAIGARGGSPGGDYSAGESYVVFGKAGGFAASFDLSTLDGTTGFRLDGIDGDDFSGRSVASAGDVNGDGFADLLIGAYLGDPGGDSAGGESYVVFGKAGGFAASFDLSTLDGVNGFRLDGIDAYDRSGRSVASAGDVNGDGFDDILIGAVEADPGGDSRAGESYVVFGKAGGFAAALDLASLDGANGFRLDGIDGGDFSGASVASAGDVNGDGFDDLVIGARGGNPGGDSAAGESYVVFGKAGGFAAALDLASLDGANGFRLDGIDASDYSGRSVASAGDVNGDGFDDLVIGADGADPGGDSSAGESYVVFGKAAGFAASFDLSTLDGANGFRLDGIDADDESGLSVASAGDVNGDGFADLVIGARGADPGGDSEAGESYVVFGRAPDAAVTRVGGAGDQYINGGAFADTLSGLGGDDRLEGRGGADDLIGGSGTDIASYAHASAAVTVDLTTLANNTGDAASDSYTTIEQFELSRFRDTFNGNSLSNLVLGLAGNDSLRGRDGNDLLDGGTGSDVMRGDAGNDTYIVNAAGDSVIESGGAGTDTVRTSLLSYTLGGNVEQLAFTGTGSFVGRGNVLANRLTGSSGNDRFLVDDGGADDFLGGSGADTMDFRGSGVGATVNLTTLVHGGAAAGDTLSSIETFFGSNSAADTFTGNGSANRFEGFGGDDLLIGNIGNDLLLGGAGADAITGGVGRDQMTGGIGTDRFDFDALAESGVTGATRDSVLDFVHLQDDLDVATIDARAGAVGNNAFSFIGLAAFTAEGQIRAVQSGANTIVEFNTTGASGAEMAVQFNGFTASTLTAADFVL